MPLRLIDKIYLTAYEGKINMTSLYSNLNHLTDEEKMKFYHRYLDESATVLIKDYKLHPSLLSKIYTLLPEVNRPVKCEFCQSETFKTHLPRKSQVLNDDPVTKATCVKCGHKVKIDFITNNILENEKKCRCSGCSEVIAQKALKIMIEMQEKMSSDSEKAEEKRLKLIKNQEDTRRFIPFSEDTEDYKLADVVTLMAIMFSKWDGLSAKNKSNDFISPIDSITGLLPDMGDDEPSLLEKAYQNKLLIIDFNNTSMNHIIEGDDSFQFYTYLCSYLPNFKNASGTPLNIKETYEFLARKFADGYWYKSWNDQLLSVWLELGVSECIEYAKLKAEEYNFAFRSEVKIREIVRELLNEYSVSECFYFISVAYYSAASFNQSNKSNGRAHAENTVPGKILSLARAGKSKKWDRDNRLARSAFSQILFDMMLNTSDDAGFYLSPGKNYYKIIDKTKVLWPIKNDEYEDFEPISIMGSEGLYDFLGRFVEHDARVSNDSEGMQIAHLSIIAEKLGLLKASKLINQRLLTYEDKVYRNSLVGDDNQIIVDEY